MSSNRNLFSDLSATEKIQLVEDLWDDIAASPEMMPIFEWQKDELERRKVNLLKYPDSGIGWEEVKSRIRSSYER